MVVGNGLIGKAFKKYDRENVVFFASGVSNSLETDVNEFLREETLLRNVLAENKRKLFVYFSTCSIYDPSKKQSPYVLHKLKMEEIVASIAKQFLIFRVSNVVGKEGNPNLLINYLIRCVEDKKTIEVYTKATRNLIDIEDVCKMFELIDAEKNFNRMVNVAYSENYSIVEILEILKKYSKHQVDFNLTEKGSGYDIEIGKEIKEYFDKKAMKNKEEYLVNILNKYSLI